MSKEVFIAVTNDISTDNRVHKVCDYLLANNFSVTVYGRVLANTVKVDRAYTIVRKKHLFSNNFFFYAEYNFHLFFYLIFRKYSYILANDLDTLPACFFASKLKNIELVYDSHELFSEGPELQGRRFVQGFWKKLEDIFLPRIKKSYTVSDSIAKFYNKKYNNSMEVVKNVPLLFRKQLKIKVNFPTKNKVVLYQGVLNPGRGIKPMIKALQFLENVDLVIIGYGKVEEELKEFVKKQGKESRVHFLGRISREILPNYTQLADVGMVLEEPLGKSFEYSLPNKLFDYIHAEIPIISGNLPEVSKIINQYQVGVCIKDYQPETIASTIKKLLFDEKLKSQIKENQKNAKQVFCWEKEQKKLDKYFKK